MGEIRVKSADGWLNLPSHKKTADGWKDTPTHIMTANGWQGELTSQSPLEFKATGQSLLDWRIDGKTSGNLFDKKDNIPNAILDAGEIFTAGELGGFLIFAKVEAGKTYSFRTSDYVRLNLRSACTTQKPTIGTSYVIDGTNTHINHGEARGFSRTIPNNANWLVIQIRDASNLDNNNMLVEGSYVYSEFPPYEPYGGVGDWDETEQKYVIPVNVRSGNLYSGAWEQGYWAYSDGTAGPGLTYIRTAKMLCKGNTKYEFVCSLPDGSKDYGFVFWGANDNFIGETHSSDVQNTPVKYSATSPANARMMAINIARYSDGERRPADILSFDLYELHETNLYTDHQLIDGDSLDYTTDQTSIPITHGDNTLTVDTAVQPSKVFVKFEG